MNSVIAPHRHKVLIIIPAYNEEGSIADVVDQIRRCNIGDVMVIDDGSDDRTVSIARRAGALVLRLPYNLGIGGAVQAGFKYAVEANYPYVIRMDGDGQHRIEEANKLLQAVQLGKADIAIGSRFLKDQQTYRPPRVRRLGIHWFAFMITLVTGEQATDTTSGMQALNQKAVKALAEYYPQDYPEVEARVVLHKSGFKTIEVPVKMQHRTSGISSITILRSIYYTIKVTLAILLTAFREIPKHHSEET
jgi:glycosyltransferase involved in cell wall biosynthesis